MLERDLQKQVTKKLKILEANHTIIWWERLNSGKINTGQYWVQLCRKGTPDFITILKNRQGNLSVLFLELKTTKGSIRPEQKEFIQKHHKNDVHCIVVRSIDDMMNYIMKIGWDRIAEIDFN